MALTKAEMAEHLFEKLGVNKRDAKDLVEFFFEEMREALEAGEQVKLSGFGNFDLRQKNERPGRNPKTGEDIPIKARRVVTFRPGQKLKRQQTQSAEHVNSQQEDQAELGQLDQRQFTPVKEAVQSLRAIERQRKDIEVQRQKQHEGQAREPVQQKGVPERMGAVAIGHGPPGPMVTATTACAPIASRPKNVAQPKPVRNP